MIPTIGITLIVYFLVLLVVSRLTGRGGNDAFFRGNRESPWPLVAFGMLGASLSGVTFVSVPGMVIRSDMTYLQMCMGFFFGYLLVAFLLIPLYYKYGLTSVYGFLSERFGKTSRKTGASFFLLSKLTGAAARLYLVCLILEMYVFSAFGIPFWLTVVMTLLLIWLYTRRSGIKTIVWTDAFQTFCLLAALILILSRAWSMLDMNIGDAFQSVWADSRSRIFEFRDWTSTQHFVKQFLSGVFIVVVMTGLDQDMMQKNLTCKSEKDAKKNLCSYGILFLPVNFLFLSLGVLLTMLYAQGGIALPAAGDSLLPGFIARGEMGELVLVCFAIGIIASAFSSADSAATALTTSFCIDILDMESPDSHWSGNPERTRKMVHLGMLTLFVAFILAFKAVGSSSVIDAIYTIAGYTYGPLLGLFAFGMLTKRMVVDKAVPFIAVFSPVVCFVIDYLTVNHTGYKFGYELLMLNGMLTFVGLWLFSNPCDHKVVQS